MCFLIRGFRSFFRKKFFLNRFENVDDFETCFNAIDKGGYDSEDVLFTE